MEPRLARSVTVVALLISSLIAGCQTTEGGHPSVNWAGTKSAYVMVTAPAFKDTNSKHVVFTDIWQHENTSYSRQKAHKQKLFISQRTNEIQSFLIST